MRKGLFYVFIALLAIGIILLNTVDGLKYLTCENPDNYIVVVNDVGDYEVDITLMTTSSAESFSSYEYHIDGDTLYIGAKFTMNPLNSNPNGSYNVILETDERINFIIAKGGSEETQVYPIDWQIPHNKVLSR